MIEWIKATDWQPPETEQVLVLRKDGSQCVAEWAGDEGYSNFPGDTMAWKIQLFDVLNDWDRLSDYYFEIHDVIYWAPLPDWPKENKNKGAE